MSKIGYNVYYAPDGCAETFIGFAETLDKALTMTECAGLEESLYETARAAGHCGGMSAPDKEHEADEPDEWFGPDGWHCAVPVFAAEAD